ncbi:hypothetical protein PRIC1_014432 [Phytophthora ramorum]
MNEVLGSMRMDRGSARPRTEWVVPDGGRGAQRLEIHYGDKRTNRRRVFKVTATHYDVRAKLHHEWKARGLGAKLVDELHVMGR